MTSRFEWSLLLPDDAQDLFKAQDELVSEHRSLIEPPCSTSRMKKVLGYPEDDSRRLEFVQQMPTASTKHGEKLKCLKLTQYTGDTAAVVGFIEYEVRNFKDALSGKGRDIYIRNIIVHSHMRRRGCAQMLYDAMFEHLGPGQLDVIRLCVMDMNQAAIKLYFKLGFKITQWYTRRLGDDACSKVVFFCMTKLQGERLNSGTPGALPLSLQNMPHLFKEQVIGEIVTFEGEAGSESECKRARIEKYDPSSQLFTLVRVPESGKQSVQELVLEVCLNDYFSTGRVTFESPLRLFLSECLSDAKPALAKADTAKFDTPSQTTGVDTPKPMVSNSVWPVFATKAKLDQESTCAVSKDVVATAPSKDKKALIKTPSKKPVVSEIDDTAINFKVRQPNGKVFKVKADTPISFQQDNPKRPKTQAYKRYEKYKAARTISQFCSIFPKKPVYLVKIDLVFDVKHKYCKCPAASPILKSHSPQKATKWSPKKVKGTKWSPKKNSPKKWSPKKCGTLGQRRKIGVVEDVLVATEAGSRGVKRQLLAQFSSPSKTAEVVVQQAAPATKRSRQDNFLHRTTLRVSAGGKINVGLEVGDLGFIVRDLDPDAQPGLHMGDVIVAVGGVLLHNDSDEDSNDEVYKQKICSRLKDSLGEAGETALAVVGSLELLRHRSLPEVQLALDQLMQSNSARGGA